MDCPWVEQPARPSRSAHSVETFRAQLAQKIGIAALISRSYYYYDWDDCWPPVPYIPYGSFAQNRFRFRSQHLSTESGDNSRRPRLGQKPRVKPAVVWLLITLFYRKKHFFILNNNKDKKHIYPFSKIHQNIVLPVQNLGGHLPPLPDAIYGPGTLLQKVSKLSLVKS